MSVSLHTAASFQQRAGLLFPVSHWGHLTFRRDKVLSAAISRPCPRGQAGLRPRRSAPQRAPRGLEQRHQAGATRLRSDIFQPPSVPFVKHQNREIQRKHQTGKRRHLQQNHIRCRPRRASALPSTSRSCLQGRPPTARYSILADRGCVPAASPPGSRTRGRFCHLSCYRRTHKQHFI